MLRRVAIVVVTGVGVLAVTATSSPPGDPPTLFASPPKSITLVLDQTRPSARFVVDVATDLVDVSSIAVRADITIDDDAITDNDGVAVVDVGLLPRDGVLGDDVDVPGDASQAAVKEGAFGVERSLGGGETGLVLAARLREGAASARVTFVLTADVFAFTDANDADDANDVVITVVPDNDGGAP